MEAKLRRRGQKTSMGKMRGMREKSGKGTSVRTPEKEGRSARVRQASARMKEKWVLGGLDWINSINFRMAASPIGRRCSNDATACADKIHEKWSLRKVNEGEKGSKKSRMEQNRQHLHNDIHPATANSPPN